MSDQRRPPVLITDIINQASSQLREAGIETPEHDAKLLLAEAAGVELRDVDRALLMGEELGTTGQLAVFRAMLDRRAKREPLQYITGHAPFRYLDLKVGPGVFIPRPETETVVQAGLDWLTKNGMIHPCVVDLCAGSGAIGLSVVSEVPGSQVWAVELSPNTAEWTRRNLSETAKKYPSIASNYHLEIADATSFATLAQLDGTVDIVITNPPYGERLLERQEAEELYRMLGRVWKTLPEGWRTLVLSSHTEFERAFGRPADKKRKLYNGMIKCDVFMYGNV